MLLLVASFMKKRNLPQFDYKIFNDTGIKVFKYAVKMTTPEVLNESKIREDINHFLRIYDHAEFTSEDEILEGLDIVNEHCQKFRHSHVELKSTLNNYSDLYKQDYENMYQKLCDFIKAAKIELKKVRLNASNLQQQEDAQKVAVQKKSAAVRV